MEIYLENSPATENLGKLLGTKVQDGDVICLTEIWVRAKPF